MMYSEFLSMTGKEESYISYKEYTESIEPIYMDCNLDTKQEFINQLFFENHLYHSYAFTFP